MRHTATSLNQISSLSNVVWINIFRVMIFSDRGISFPSSLSWNRSGIDENIDKTADTPQTGRPICAHMRRRSQNSSCLKHLGYAFINAMICGLRDDMEPLCTLHVLPPETSQAQISQPLYHTAQSVSNDTHHGSGPNCRIG